MGTFLFILSLGIVVLVMSISSKNKVATLLTLIVLLVSLILVLITLYLKYILIVLSTFLVGYLVYKLKTKDKVRGPNKEQSAEQNVYRRRQAASNLGESRYTKDTNQGDYTIKSIKEVYSNTPYSTNYPTYRSQVIDNLIRDIRTFRPELKFSKQGKEILKYIENDNTLFLYHRLKNRGWNVLNQYLLKKKPSRQTADLYFPEDKIIVEAKSDLISDPYTPQQLKGLCLEIARDFPTYLFLIVIYGDARVRDIEDIKIQGNLRYYPIVLGTIKQERSK